MSGSTLSRELHRQAPHYLWQTPHPATHSPQACRHSALGVTATPCPEEDKGRGGLHHTLAALLTSRLPALAAAILPQQQQHTSITWIPISDDSVSLKAVFIKAAVAQYKDVIFQDKRNHASGRPTVVAYCSDNNFGKEGVTSAFGAKVHIGASTTYWYMGFYGKTLDDDPDIHLYYSDPKKLTVLTTNPAHSR